MLPETLLLGPSGVDGQINAFGWTGKRNVKWVTDQVSCDLNPVR